MTSPEEALLDKYPTAKIVQVRQQLDAITFDTQKTKHENRHAEGGAIGIVWLGERAVVLARRTQANLHPGWALLGGTVEKDQEFDKAFEREVKEEAGLDIDVKRLVLFEHKTFVSPTEDEVAMKLAVFEAIARSGQQIVKTPEAIEEGLEVRAFAIDELPEEMALKDREKLEEVISNTDAN